MESTVEDKINPRQDIVGEFHGLGLGVFGEDGYFFEISGHHPVRVSGEALAAEAPFDAFGGEPYPAQDPPYVQEWD